MCDEGTNDLYCGGRTGKQVLQTLHTNFPIATHKDNYGRNLLIVVIIALTFKVTYFALFYRRTTYSKGPKSISK